MNPNTADVLASRYSRGAGMVELAGTSACATGGTSSTVTFAEEGRGLE